MDRDYPFVLRAYESQEAYAQAMSLAESCDILVVGVAKEEVVARHRPAGSVSFKYSERLYRKKTTFADLLSRLRFAKYTFVTCLRHPHYMLCSSAYTASDYGMFGNYWGKTFKWGYFPEAKKYDVEELLGKKRENKRIQLLWVARMLKLKRPEAMVFLARDLKERGYDFDLNMIGVGEELPNVQKMIRQMNLERNIHLLGSMEPQTVRSYMETADIFLFTSNRQEGWGAVLNESMNSACAVVASKAIGSVPFLIHHKRNGIIYRDGSQRALNRAVRALINDRELRERLGKNAYQTISETWNGEEAARRLLDLSRALMAGKRTPFRSGPCSRAHMIGKSR